MRKAHPNKKEDHYITIYTNQNPSIPSKPTRVIKANMKTNEAGICI